MADTSHLDTGIAGENLIADYLIACGWEILERRWRDPRAGRGATDIDLIARSADRRYHFIEVKTRTGDRCQYVDFAPEPAVTPAKARRIAAAAERYLACSGIVDEIQIDIAAVILSEHPGTRPEIRYYPNIVR